MNEEREETKEESERGGFAAPQGGSAAPGGASGATETPTPAAFATPTPQRRVLFELSETSLEPEPEEKPLTSFKDLLSALKINPAKAETKYKEVAPCWRIIGSLQQPSLRTNVLDFTQDMVRHSNELNRRSASVAKFQTPPTAPPYLPTSVRLKIELTYPPRFKDDAEITNLAAETKAIVEQAEKDLAAKIAASARRIEALVKQERLQYFAESLIDILCKALVYHANWKQAVEYTQHELARTQRQLAAVCLYQYYQRKLASEYTTIYLACTKADAEKAILFAASQDPAVQESIKNCDPELTNDEKSLKERLTSLLDSFLKPVTAELQNRINIKATEALVNSRCAAQYKSAEIETATAATADALEKVTKLDDSTVKEYIRKSVKEMNRAEKDAERKRKRDESSETSPSTKKKKKSKPTKNNKGGGSAQTAKKPAPSKGPKKSNPKSKRALKEEKKKGNANPEGKRSAGKSGKKEKKQKKRDKKRK